MSKGKDHSRTKTSRVQTVFRTGNSLVVALPAGFRQKLGIEPGDTVIVNPSPQDNSITYQLTSRRQLSLINNQGD